MSRGPGRVQRSLMELFEREPGLLADTFELAVRVYKVEPDAEYFYGLTDAQLSAVRRSLIALAKDGQLCAVRGLRGGRQHWAMPETLVKKARSRPGMFDAHVFRHGTAKAFYAAMRHKRRKKRDGR